MTDDLLAQSEIRRSSTLKLFSISNKDLSHHVIPHIIGNVPKEQMAQNPTNRLKTTKYNVFTFLPIQIFIQFTKVINLFYLLNVILQCIKSISTNSPISTIVPLAFVVCLAILKDLISEIIRYREDTAFNKSLCRRLVAQNLNKIGQINSEVFEFESARLDEIKVGDILELKDDDLIPADCILLKT